VHLAGFTPEGAHWVQQRAFDKPNDPGLWDTLMGGMVSAADTVATALARETWEEAGFRLEQLAQLRPGGCIATRRPSDRPHGYVVEQLHWFRCVLPAGVGPVNRDGEVAQFARMPADEVEARMHAGEFTLEARLILRQALAHAA
jgi:8-oxo-dGTP pyrophosphatase MutT (NUDIX family)